jgi:hypothetical protein
MASVAMPALAEHFAPAPGTKASEPYAELPILTWQERAELTSTVEQVLFNAYTPLLARPTPYRGIHNDPIPNQMSDFDFHREDVQRELLAREDAVDAQSRMHAALPDAEVNRLISKKIAFRPEQLEPLLTSSMRFSDIIVTVHRVQPLGGDWFRVDFDVKTVVANGGVENTEFHAVDIQRNGTSWLLPMKVLLDLAPLQGLAASLDIPGGPGVKSLAGKFIAIAKGSLKSLLPALPIPF